MNFKPGDRIGDHEILKELGAGGMGRVYKVRNTISDRVEAMKILLPDLQNHPDLAERFLREIKVQAKLSHPNIAALYATTRHENQLLMLMEFVEGSSLEGLLRNGPLTPQQGVDCVSQVLSALSYAHANGVVHRDIKPANIIVTPQGVTKLMDFGIAKLREDKRLTQTGHTLGSLYYMSPEQIKGDALDARADIYSLGITLYEAMTGKRPFDATSDFAIMAAHLQQMPPPPIQVDPRVPASLNEIIMMAIAKDPKDRFQTADAFRNALLGALGPAQVATATAILPKPVAAPPPPVPAAPPPPSSRRLYMAAGSVATLVVLALGLTQLPKLFHTSANTELAQQPIQTPVQTPPVERPVEKPVEPATVPPDNPAPVRKEPKATPPAPVPQTPVTPVTQPVQAAVPPPVQQTPPHETKPAPVTPPVASTPAPTVDRAQLESLRERMMKLAARVGAIQQKVRRIESEQAAQGLGMRSDVKAGQSRMTFLMDEVENALKADNAGAAKTNLDKAEREVEKLEGILGI